MTQVDVIVIGAGFGGMRALHTLRGQGLSVTVLEASDDVGGVWHVNRYPGARCDVESYDYSYMFSEELEQEWRWTERYATQPEVLRYIHHVADRFDLRRHIELNTRMTSAEYDEDAARWTVTADDGRTWTARYFLMAVGNLSTTKQPQFLGEETFEGPILHTAAWPKEPVDFTGKRVGIIGTGSSGVQMTPVVAQQCEHLTVFQRTANFSVPAANAPVSDEEDAAVKANYRARRRAALDSPSGLGFSPGQMSALDHSHEERENTYASAWNRSGFGFALAYKDVLLHQGANDTAADFARRQIASRVHDPEIREKLTPRGFPFGARRPSVDSGYFEAFNRDNVTLVDVKAAPIEEITPTGLRTADAHYPLDILVYATGFDAFTGSLLRPTIVGRGGKTLREAWSAGPVTYLGIGVPDFPNMFIVVGPGSPSLLSNVILSIEQQVDWLGALVAHAEANEIDTIEVTREATRDWVALVNERAKETLYPKAASYYMGAEVAGKPQVFMPFSGGVRGYRRILEKVAANGYDGFDMHAPSKAEAAVA